MSHMWLTLRGLVLTDDSCIACKVKGIQSKKCASYVTSDSSLCKLYFGVGLNLKVEIFRKVGLAS